MAAGIPQQREPVTVRHIKSLDWQLLIRDIVMPASVKLTAYTLATYANADGTNVRPGLKRLMATTQQGESTVRNALKFLRENGLLWRTSQGSSTGKSNTADVYWLGKPDDYEERFTLVPRSGALDEDYRTVHARPNRLT